MKKIHKILYIGILNFACGNFEVKHMQNVNIEKEGNIFSDLGDEKIISNTSGMYINDSLDINSITKKDQNLNINYYFLQNADFFNLVNKNNSSTIKQILTSAEINTQVMIHIQNLTNNFGQTLLLRAIENDNENITKLLLPYSKILQRDISGDDVLACGIRKGNFEIIEAIIKEIKDRYLVSRFKKQKYKLYVSDTGTFSLPSFLAAMTNDEKIFNLVFDTFFQNLDEFIKLDNITSKWKYGYPNAFMIAVANGNEQCVKALLNKDIGLSRIYTDRFGYKCSVELACAGHDDLKKPTKFIIDNTFIINKKEPYFNIAKMILKHKDYKIRNQYPTHDLKLYISEFSELTSKEENCQNIVKYKQDRKEIEEIIQIINDIEKDSKIQVSKNGYHYFKFIPKKILLRNCMSIIFSPFKVIKNKLKQNAFKKNKKEHLDLLVKHFDYDLLHANCIKYLLAYNSFVTPMHFGIDNLTFFTFPFIILFFSNTLMMDHKCNSFINTSIEYIYCFIVAIFWGELLNSAFPGLTRIWSNSGWIIFGMLCPLSVTFTATLLSRKK